MWQTFAIYGASSFKQLTHCSCNTNHGLTDRSFSPVIWLIKWLLNESESCCWLMEDEWLPGTSVDLMFSTMGARVTCVCNEFNAKQSFKQTSFFCCSVWQTSVTRPIFWRGDVSIHSLYTATSMNPGMPVVSAGKRWCPRITSRLFGYQASSLCSEPMKRQWYADDWL